MLIPVRIQYRRFPIVEQTVGLFNIILIYERLFCFLENSLKFQRQFRKKTMFVSLDSTPKI